MFGKNKKTTRSRQPQSSEIQDDTTFRRSRTLQGTTSPHVKAANQKRALLKSERLKKQQTDRRKRHVTTIMALTIVSVIIVVYVFGQYQRGIDVVSITNQDTTSRVPTDKYRQAVNDYFSEMPAERLSFALDHTALDTHIRESLPEVKHVKSTGVHDGQGSFEVTLRKPVASWQSSNIKSYVDSEGVSFSTNYFDQPKVTIVDNSGIESVSERDDRGVVVSERFLKFLGRLIALTNSSGIGSVKDASLPKDTTREIDVRIENKPFLIKTHIDRDPAATVEDIGRVINYLEKKKIQPSYIDVRVNGRAYYK